MDEGGKEADSDTDGYRDVGICVTGHQEPGHCEVHSVGGGDLAGGRAVARLVVVLKARLNKCYFTRPSLPIQRLTLSVPFPFRSSLEAVGIFGNPDLHLPTRLPTAACQCAQPRTNSPWFTTVHFIWTRHTTHERNLSDRYPSSQHHREISRV